MIHAQQIGLVADVNHDGSFPTGLSVFLFRSHATVFFAADIFFAGEKSISVGMRVEETHHSISGRN